MSKEISFRCFESNRLLIISREDGNRGPLGVACAVNQILARKHHCVTKKCVSFLELLSSLLMMPFRYRNYSICVHANGYRIPFILHLISMLDGHNRYYCVLHGVSAEEAKYRPVSNLDIILEKIIFENFPNIVCVSDYQYQILSNYYHARSNVSVVGNGSYIQNDCTFSELIVDKYNIHYPTFITTGGFESRKGVDLALKMLVRFAETTNTTPNLIVCGRDDGSVGSNRPECDRIAEEGKITLHYYGEIHDKSELFKLYCSSDFYLGFSRFDTFNVSILEAAANCCIPCISRENGAASLFNDSGCVISNLADPDWMEKTADALSALYRDRFNCVNVAKECYDIACNNSWDVVAERYWRLLANEC